jgi:acyl carrier protein
MTREEALTQIIEVFKDVLDDDAISLNEETTASDVEEWDSLNHIQLVVAVEKKFKVKPLFSVIGVDLSREFDCFIGVEG